MRIHKKFPSSVFSHPPAAHSVQNPIPEPFAVGLPPQTASQIDYRVKRGRLAVFRPSGNPRGKRKVSLEAVREAYPDVYESLLQRAASFEEQ